MSKEYKKTPMDHRVDLGLTQEALATKAGVSVETVFRAEKNKKWPAMPLTRRKYIRALGLDPAVIDAEVMQTKNKSPEGPIAPLQNRSK